VRYDIASLAFASELIAPVSATAAGRSTGVGNTVKAAGTVEAGFCGIVASIRVESAFVYIITGALIRIQLIPFIANANKIGRCGSAKLVAGIGPGGGGHRREANFASVVRIGRAFFNAGVIYETTRTVCRQTPIRVEELLQSITGKGA
jgi:hypothetical protein